MPLPALPIDPLLPEILSALGSQTRLVLVAPPGAGKTTRVPPALLSAPWLASKKLIVLEPRRLAARAAARRMASQLGERVGETIGYRVHLDTVVGPRTRIEVVTEGVLTRMLQSDATLADAGAVLFDEFHERSLHADLGLALTLHAQRLVRDDLRIVVMSATLDGERVAQVIDAPLIQSEGRAYPVEMLYRPRREREWIEDAAVRITREALDEHDGDALVFLPGAAEIRRTADRLRAATSDSRVDIRPLYGDLPGDEQDAAIAPSPAGRRKVVLATNIAETSLTIEGVCIVVDCGLARTPRYSPRTGLTRLETVRISRASADQRRGRAGRTAPGVCYRAWSEGDDAQLAPRNVPEILDADLTPLALELATAGIEDPATLTWLDPPPAGALAQGREILRELGALSNELVPTPYAHRLAGFPAHPRLAHMLLRGDTIGQSPLASALAALLSNRDVLRPVEAGARIDADLHSRLDAFAGQRPESDTRIDHDALRRVRQDARNWRDRLGASNERFADTDAAGLLLSFAFPDRIARKRPGGDGRFLLRNGTGAHFAEPQALGGEEWLVIAESDGRVPESRIYLAAPVSLEELSAHHAETFVTTDDVEWDDAADRVVTARRTRFGAVVVREQTLRDPPPGLVLGALLGAIKRRGIGALPWSDAAQRLRERLAFAHRLNSSWPDASDAALLATLDDWLAPALANARTMADVARADLSSALLARLDWKQRAQLDTLAPTHITVPSGSNIAVDYSDPAAPALHVRLQEMYGQPTTPSVGNGAVSLTLHLLSPARRPVQVTRDLAQFWRGSYAEVRKEMRGRYPKHDWPENPTAAAPSRGRKKK